MTTEARCWRTRPIRSWGTHVRAAAWRPAARVHGSGKVSRYVLNNGRE